MDIAINTDFLTSTRSPEPWLMAIAEAGFTHLHWCHQWNTDFLYSADEIKQIALWLKTYGLKLLDIHGSTGVEKMWHSPVEYQRRAGVELVKNRAIMLRQLGGTGSLMMHAPCLRESYTAEQKNRMLREHDAVRRSLDDLMPVLEKYGVLIAIENMHSENFELIRNLLAGYPEERLGITYDSGHGNIGSAQGLDYLTPVRSRLQALHLNDNDTSGDLHQPPFYGTVDWERMTDILADSGYRNKPLSFELSMRNTPFFDRTKETPVDQDPEKIRAFLADAYERCMKVVSLYEAKRAGH